MSDKSDKPELGFLGIFFKSRPEKEETPAPDHRVERIETIRNRIKARKEEEATIDEDE